jgi:hypothetical protein
MYLCSYVKNQKNKRKIKEKNLCTYVLMSKNKKSSYVKNKIKKQISINN